MRCSILAALAALPLLMGGQSSGARLQKSHLRAGVLPESKRALTLTGPLAALAKSMADLSSRPHSWEAGPIKQIGEMSRVRLRWPKQPSYRDLGGILYLAQLNGLHISETELIEQQS